MTDSQRIRRALEYENWPDVPGPVIEIFARMLEQEREQCGQTAECFANGYRKELAKPQTNIIFVACLNAGITTAEFIARSIRGTSTDSTADTKPKEGSCSLS